MRVVGICEVSQLGDINVGSHGTAQWAEALPQEPFASQAAECEGAGYAVRVGVGVGVGVGLDDAEWWAPEISTAVGGVVEEWGGTWGAGCG